jgi:hypothetical protein
MTTTQPGGPGSPHEQAPGPQAPAGFPALPGPWPYGPPPSRRNKGTAFAIAVVGLLAVAALVVSIVDLTRSPTTSSTSNASSPSSSVATTAPADTTTANRVLCTAIAPLMTEDNRVAKSLSDQAPSSSPGWSTALPKFVSDTKDWLGRIQPVIDSHPNVDPYLSRSLNRFVDDQRYLVGDLQGGGPWAPYDQTIWNDSLGAVTGPLNVCWDLGVKW